MIYFNCLPDVLLLNYHWLFLMVPGLGLQNVIWILFTVPVFGLQRVIVVFPDHTHLHVDYQD